ncbi:hypothetical protein [Streptomyces sp. NPDC085665]|uniref:hypothetical protein n=1 Tax=Streptomyces sp. NPDC085665 TaxID=3365735 RepID=UPI0037D04710
MTYAAAQLAPIGTTLDGDPDAWTQIGTVDTLIRTPPDLVNEMPALPTRLTFASIGAPRGWARCVLYGVPYVGPAACEQTMQRIGEALQRRRISLMLQAALEGDLTTPSNAIASRDRQQL